jgi:hypothetical protein
MVQTLITRSQTNQQIWPPQVSFFFHFVKNDSNSNAEHSMQQNTLLKSEWLCKGRKNAILSMLQYAFAEVYYTHWKGY